MIILNFLSHDLRCLNFLADFPSFPVKITSCLLMLTAPSSTPQVGGFLGLTVGISLYSLMDLQGALVIFIRKCTDRISHFDNF